MEKQETRTIKELLQLMLDNFHLFEIGLCKLVAKLDGAYGDEKLINDAEHTMLVCYIIHNRPIYSKFHIYSIFNPHPGYYYWPKEWKYPRKQWLKKHIKKLNKSK